jgi:hypothetical protein
LNFDELKQWIHSETNRIHNYTTDIIGVSSITLDLNKSNEKNSFMDRIYGKTKNKKSLDALIFNSNSKIEYSDNIIDSIMSIIILCLILINFMHYKIDSLAILFITRNKNAN